VPQYGGKGFNRYKINLPIILTGWTCIFFEEMFDNREDGIKGNASEIQVTICYDNVIRRRETLRFTGNSLFLWLFES
jgi:hypothetical protein